MLKWVNLLLAYARVNFQTLNGKDQEGDKIENKILTGFNVGANAENSCCAGFLYSAGRFA